MVFGRTENTICILTTRTRREPKRRGVSPRRSRGRQGARQGSALALEFTNLLGKNATRTRILGGATTAFSKKGFASCTVQSILEAAGVSRRTFYQFFANKEEVLDALFELATSWLIEQIRNSVETEDDLGTKLARGIDAFLALQELAGPLLPELLAEAQRLESRLSARHERTLDEITSLFAEGVNARYGYEVDPLVFRGLLLTLEGVLLHLGRKGSFTREDAQHVRRVILPLMMRVVAEPGAELPSLPSIEAC